MSSRRRARDDSDDERTPRRSSNWFKEVQSEHRASGKVLADVEAAEPKRPSVRVAPTPAAPVQATSAPSAPATTGPTKIFSGLVAVAPVPFLPSNTLRTEAYANYVASLKEDGITAVYINSAWGGESNSLTVQERTQVADWFATYAPSLRIAVNVSAPSVADSITLAKHAQSVRAAAIVVSVPVINAGSFVTLEDALDFINEVSHAVAATPLFIEHSDGTSFGLTDILSAASARGLISNLRGVISRSGDMSQLSGALAIKGQLTDVIYGGEVNVVSAAFLGATSFCAREFSFIGPLYAKIVAAAQKGDVATSQQLSQLLSNFFQSVLGVVGTCDARRAAAAKVLTTLRTSSDFGSVRPPAPRLTVHEAARISDAFGAFIKTYVAQTKPTPAAAPKPIKERDGYLGKLNPAIVERIAVMESAIGVRNLVSYFPHLRVSDGSWRKSYPAENKCNPARHIDHTILKAEATRKEITTLCQEAKQNHFFAVCVNGSRVAQCLDELDGSDVKVAAVIGFPLGAGTSKAKAREARELIDMGAAEIDMVMNIGAMKDGNYRLVYEDVKAVVDAATPGIVKVIFETCLLSQTEIIDASILCVAAGAQFVKTSTGFNKAGATPDVLDVMLAVVGNESETKAAGGVRDFATAAAYVSAGVSRIGTSSGVAIISGKPAGAGY